MRKFILAAAMIAAGLMSQSAFAQCSGGCGVGGDGMTQPTCAIPGTGLFYAARDPYSPHPLYAYGPAGRRASWEHSWNQNRMQSTSWHGSHNYWRWGTPTALVVPPTAAFQSQYAWGVGQVRSMPINHQFGRAQGFGGAGAGEGMFGNTPYWPSNTSQFGVYPVRGPWN